MAESRSSRELFKMLHACNGMRYKNRRKARAFTLNVFEGNLADLRKICSLIEDPKNGLRLMNASMDSGNNSAHMEALRHFHNFLAAAKSLVDQTRTFVDEYYAGTTIQNAYEQKVQSEFSQDPLAKFVQELRNYMLHRNLPASSMTINLDGIENSIAKSMTTSVTINKQGIEEWKGWTKLSRQYLQQADEKIPISSISNPYSKKVLDFYCWFDLKLEKFHQVELEELRRLQKEYSLADEREKEMRAGAE